MPLNLKGKTLSIKKILNQRQLALTYGNTLNDKTLPEFHIMTKLQTINYVTK